MCGICGIALRDAQNPADRAMLARMNGTLVHRGPDSHGMHVAPGVGLAIRRLSIIDVAHGDQPLANEDGSVTVVCNGEIYNHVELRAALEARGHAFRTHADVEVIAHLYEDHGSGFVSHLRGMFAIALWDARERKLLLVRDRLGIKPLHYAVTAAGLLFASEQKAIVASGLIEAEPDPGAIAQAFSYGRVIGARTMVKDLRRLLPGHVLTFASGSVAIDRYWDAAFPDRREYDRRTSAAAWAVRLREKLAEAVALHLRSDVPVGAWLSAGIDSSSVTALMARAQQSPVPTFTLRFEDARFDELGQQKALDDYPAYRLDGHRVFCGARDLALLPEAIWHGEDTLMAGIMIGRLVLARATAGQVKVVLTGEGADEALGGYSWYPTWRALQPVFVLPQSVRRGLAALPWLHRRWPGAAGIIAGERTMSFERYSRSVTHLRATGAGAAVLADDFAAGAHDDLLPGDASLPDGFGDWHPFAQLQYLDLRHRLADSVEQSLDRGSMAASVEARVPFLDHEFVEFCARIPPWVKMQWLREKQVLRRAMDGVLPADIVRRRKRPMQVPTGSWMRGRLPDFAEALLSHGALREKGFFDPRKVADARRRHARGEDLGMVLMSVLGLQLWDELFRRGRPLQAFR